MLHEVDLLDHGESCSISPTDKKGIHSILLFNSVLKSIISMTRYLLQFSYVVICSSPLFPMV